MTSTSNFTSLLPSLLIHSPNRTLLPDCCEDGEVTITRCSEAGWALQSTGRQEQTPVLDSGPLPCFTLSRESQTLPGPAGTTRGSGWEGKLCGPGEESGRTAWAISLRLLAKVSLVHKWSLWTKGWVPWVQAKAYIGEKTELSKSSRGRVCLAYFCIPAQRVAERGHCYATAKGSSGQILVATTGKAPRAT